MGMFGQFDEELVETVPLDCLYRVQGRMPFGICPTGRTIEEQRRRHHRRKEFGSFSQPIIDRAWNAALYLGFIEPIRTFFRPSMISWLSLLASVLIKGLSAAAWDRKISRLSAIQLSTMSCKE